MRDFTRKTLNALKAKGVVVLRAQAAPAYEGDTSFSGRVYQIAVDSCSKMRTHSQVLELIK